MAVTTIKSSPGHAYWNAAQNVGYPTRCAWYEAVVMPAREVDQDRDRGWAWMAGEAVDPIAGGLGRLEWESAALRGIVGARRDAEKLARAAFREVAERGDA